MRVTSRHVPLLVSCLLVCCGGQASHGTQDDDGLGDSDVSSANNPTLELEGVALTDLVAGERLCGLDERGRAVCEGGGFDVEGEVVKLASTSPDHVHDLYCMLFRTGEVECSYPYFATKFDALTAVDLSLSYQMALIATEHGEIFGSWGQRLTDKTYQKVQAGVGFGCAIDVRGGLTCFGYPREEDLMQEPAGEFRVVYENSDEQFVAVYVNDLSGEVPFCAVSKSGHADCWWLRNADDQSYPLEGTVRTTDAFVPEIRIVDLAIGLREICAIDEMRQIVCWNHTEASEQVPLVKNPLDIPAVSIAVSTNALDFCILDELGAPHCWRP